MQNQDNHSKLKAIIGVLSILLIGSLIYIFKLTSDAKTLQTTVTTVKSEKESVLKDLADLKTNYDAAIAENTTMSDELIDERDKVVKLIADLKASKGDNASLQKYKTQYKAMEQKMQNLMQEVAVLKKQNQTLTTNLDSTTVELEDNKKYNQVLVEIIYC